MANTLQQKDSAFADTGARWTVFKMQSLKS